MLSDLLSILEKVDLEDVTGLDDKCIQIMFFLLVNPETVYNHNQLLKEVNKFGFSMSGPTFTDHLDHLEEAEYIVRDRFADRTDIYVNVTDLESKKKLMAAVDLTLDLSRQYKEEASDFDTRELFEIMKLYSMQKVSSQFLLRLKLVNGSVSEEQFNIRYTWSTLLYDFLLDSYLDDVLKRGDQTVIELLDMYY